MSVETARAILTRPSEFPMVLLSRADVVLREWTAKNVEKVGLVAEREGWLKPLPVSRS